MKTVARWLLPMSFAMLAQAQGLDTPPVPTWPDVPNLPPASGHYVFLKKDRHTIVVLAPDDPNTGLRGPTKIVKVPLWNDLTPSMKATVTEADGKITYRYSLTNGPDASDEIGRWALIVPPNDPNLRVIDPAPNGSHWWSGSPAFATIARHAIFPELPLGRYLAGFYRDDHVIRPGETLGGFGVESNFRPGLTTAWLASGKLVEFDQSWPREIFRDLERFEDRQWREKYVVTVGPMFPPDIPEETMVQSFRYCLKQMSEAGWLNPSAPFTKEVAGMLGAWKPSQPAETHLLRALPAAGMEREVATALRISLKIRLAE